MGKTGLRSATRHGRAPRRWTHFASRLLSCALAVVFLAGTVLAGSRYFYCPGMGVSQFTSCCAHQESETDHTATLLVAESCCESRVMRDLPRAQIHAPPVVADAPLVAVLPLFPPYEPPLVPPARPVRVRSGSDPPTPSEARSQLMVFLT